MSTRAYFSQDRCPDQESLVSFLYDEFDGSEAFDRRTVASHLEACDRCARNIASLGGVRNRLRAWDAPDSSPLGLRIVSDTSPHQVSGWAGWIKPALPLAAAAILVVGAGLGLARLDIQYDKNGFRVRTGWGHEEQTASRGLGTATGSPVGMNTPVAAAGILAPASETANRAPWQSDMQILAQTLRQELATARQADASGARVGAPAVSAAEAALYKRVQQMIDQAEVRQQQNLALRVTELSRDFDLQRRSDMAQIEQGFGRLAGQRELDAQQSRQLLNAIRTSQIVPVAPR
jgi:hypothetical protein